MQTLVIPYKVLVLKITVFQCCSVFPSRLYTTYVLTLLLLLLSFLLAALLKAKILFTNVGAAIVFVVLGGSLFFPAAAVSAYIFCIKFTASDKTPKTRCISLTFSHIEHSSVTLSLSA